MFICALYQYNLASQSTKRLPPGWTTGVQIVVGADIVFTFMSTLTV